MNEDAKNTHEHMTSLTHEVSHMKMHTGVCWVCRVLTQLFVPRWPERPDWESQPKLSGYDRKTRMSGPFPNCACQGETLWGVNGAWFRPAIMEYAAKKKCISDVCLLGMRD